MPVEKIQEKYILKFWSKIQGGWLGGCLDGWVGGWIPVSFTAYCSPIMSFDLLIESWGAKHMYKQNLVKTNAKLSDMNTLVDS